MPSAAPRSAPAARDGVNRPPGAPRRGTDGAERTERDEDKERHEPQRPLEHELRHALPVAERLGKRDGCGADRQKDERRRQKSAPSRRTAPVRPGDGADKGDRPKANERPGQDRPDVDVEPHVIGGRCAVAGTAGYETVVAASLSAAGRPVVVVNPAQVRAFAKALGKRAKTDPIDAAIIAHFVEATKPDVRPLPDEATRQLSGLVTRRSQIPAMIVAEQQRKKHQPNKRMLASIERLLAALQRELSDLDGQIREAIKASPVSRRHARTPANRA